VIADLAAIAHRNTGALLAAVLQRVEPEKGHACNIGVWRDNAEYTALVMRFIVSIIEGGCTERKMLNHDDLSTSAMLVSLVQVIALESL
jgi:hypothetical protein